MAVNGDRIRIGTGGAGVERLEAYFHGQAYALHRHDTYAIGITLAGVQSFQFRGARWQCLPGQCHVLHPDELHDGGAGTEDGFGYRIVHIDPALIQDALSRDAPGARALPFVAQPVLDPARFPKVRAAADIWDIDSALDEMARVELVAAAAALLAEAATGGARTPGALALDSLTQVRDRIAASPAERPSMAELEGLSGLDRWSLARQFRAAFGTSPSRFRTLRQLDQVRHLLKDGTPLADAATEAGFADQSHMSRQFKRAYGLTPARWAASLI